MPSKKASYATIKSLYGELEAARRVWEAEGQLPWKSRSDGGQAYVLWLELLDIAEWLGGSENSDDEDDDVEDAVGASEGQDDLPEHDEDSGDVPSLGSVARREHAGVHQAAGIQSPVAADELVQQPLPGAVGGALPGLTYTVNKRKNRAPLGR